MFHISDLKDMKLKDLKNLDKDDLFDVLGLEPRRDTVDWLAPTLGAFSVGVLLGAGIGLLMAPKSGARLRDDLRDKLEDGQEALATAATQARETIKKNI